MCELTGFGVLGEWCLFGARFMDSLSDHYHRMVGLDANWSIANVDLNTESQTLTLTLKYTGKGVVCPECDQTCAKKDHAAERSWRHLDAMQHVTRCCSIPRT